MRNYFGKLRSECGKQTRRVIAAPFSFFEEVASNKSFLVEERVSHSACDGRFSGPCRAS